MPPYNRKRSGMRKRSAFFIPIFAVAGVKTPAAEDTTLVKKCSGERKSMKREFLQNLSDALSKEVIDAIMEENGKDIQRAKADAVKPFGDYEQLKQQLAQSLVDGKSAQQWKAQYDQAAQQHEQALFTAALNTAIEKAGGRNAKAITALLDVETLKASRDQTQAIAAAVEALRAEEGYLFGCSTPPAFATGTGTRRMLDTAPTTLAGALKERLERK